MIFCQAEEPQAKPTNYWKIAKQGSFMLAGLCTISRPFVSSISQEYEYAFTGITTITMGLYFTQDFRNWLSEVKKDNKYVEYMRSAGSSCAGAALTYLAKENLNTLYYPDGVPIALTLCFLTLGCLFKAGQHFSNAWNNQTTTAQN